MWGEPSLHDFISSFMWVFAPVICVFFQIIVQIKGDYIMNKPKCFFNHFTAKKPAAVASPVVCPLSPAKLNLVKILG